MDTTQAYAVCKSITRTRAANFYYGIRLLAEQKRIALCAVYALARRIDDIGDGSLGADQKLHDLEVAREGLDHLTLDSDDAVLVALADASTRLPIPLSAFGELIDGVEMDVRGTSYQSFDDLVVYCRRVAGTIGRLSLGVFGSNQMSRAVPLADTLGVALQLTNILRDIREDLLNGRVYLPRDDLERFGCELDLKASADSAFVALIRFEAERASRWFDEGLQLLALLDSRSAACAGAMASIYQRLLRRIEREPEAVLRRRVSLPAWEKAWVAAQSLARA